MARATLCWCPRVLRLLRNINVVIPQSGLSTTLAPALTRVITIIHNSGLGIAGHNRYTTTFLHLFLYLGGCLFRQAFSDHNLHIKNNSQ